MKGGYKIIDFKNVSLSGTPVTMADVLVDLLNNYEKVVLLSHVVLSGSAKDDCFSTVLSDGAGGVKLNCYDGYISINSSGAVTYTVASASGMAGDIEDLQSDLADTNGMIAPAWSATETYTKNSIVRYGGKLYKAISNVPTNILPTDVTYWVEDIISNDIKTYLDSEPAILKRIPFTLNAGTTQTIELNRLTRAVLIMIGSSENFNNIFLINTTTQSAVSYRKVFSTDNFSINVEEANLFKITNTNATYSALGYLIILTGSGTILS